MDKVNGSTSQNKSAPQSPDTKSPAAQTGKELPIIQPVVRRDADLIASLAQMTHTMDGLDPIDEEQEDTQRVQSNPD